MNNTFKVAIWGFNTADKYSGGRIHAWTMAQAFAANNCDVDFYTNAKPVFVKEFKDFSKSEKIQIKINKYFVFFPQIKYDLIIIVPHLSFGSRKYNLLYNKLCFYNFIKLFKFRSRCPVWFLDFESPNWINKILPGVRSYDAYKYSDKIIKHVEGIICTTKTGEGFSKAYYTQFNHEARFFQLYLSINSFAADKVGVSLKRENKIMFFGRFAEKHKGGKIIVNIIKSLPKKCKLLIIGSKEDVPEELNHEMFTAASSAKVTIEFKKNISDEEKFYELATSKLLIFNSEFEGYGLPPIEAQYVGTPVLCSNLPVLREVNTQGNFIDFNDLDKLKNQIDYLYHDEKVDRKKLHEAVAAFANFKNYTENLKHIINTFFGYEVRS